MIKRAEKEDAEILARLAIQMWEDHTLAELEDEFKEITEKEDAACFIKYVDDVPIAFAQSGRSYKGLSKESVVERIREIG